MTVRLGDREPLTDRDEAEAARLLAVLRPSEPDPVMESRVYARLVAQPGRMARRHWVVACVGLLLVSSTILAAALMYRWLGQAHPAAEAPSIRATEQAEPRLPAGEPPSQEPRALSVPSAPESPGASQARPLPGPHAAQSHTARPRPLPPRSAEPGTLAGKPDEPAPPASAQAAPESTSSEARMAAAPTEEAALVLGALRSLRRGHDPAGAQALLGQYLARFPRGVLVEEALALGMEAALDRNDTATGRRLGDEYLRRYPAGRFTSLAQRAIGNPGL